MNLLVQKGINDLGEQSKNLIESEMQDQSANKKENNGQNPPNEQNQPNEQKQQNEIRENIEINEGAKGKKKKKKLVVNRALSIRMYTFVFIHTLILTIVLFYFHLKSDNIVNDIIDEKIKDLTSLLWFVVLGLLMISIIISFSALIINISLLNFILFIILLASNALMFMVGGKLSSFSYPISMLIMFDSASLVILIFLSLIKDNPSTFWIMCSCVAGNLLTMYILSHVFSENKYSIFLICIISFGIYETMNYKALDCKNNTLPSMLSLPFSLNISIFTFIYYIFYGFFYLLKNCCCPGKK